MRSDAQCYTNTIIEKGEQAEISMSPILRWLYLVLAAGLHECGDALPCRLCGLKVKRSRAEYLYSAGARRWLRSPRKSAPCPA